MAGHHQFSLSQPAPILRQGYVSLTGQIQTQAMSHAKFIFLIALVIFFITLFVVAYVWMRRPSFGQKGGHQMPAGSRSGFAQSVRGESGELRADVEAPAVEARQTREER
jgi:hypothetical protein